MSFQTVSRRRSPKRARNRSAAPMRCSRSRHCKASTPLRTSASRRKKSSQPWRSSGSALFLTVRSGRAFLTGKIDESTSLRQRSNFAQQRYRASLRKRARANQALVELLRSVGGRRGVTPAQTRSPGRSRRKPWIVPLFGTRKLDRLDENLGSPSVALTAGDLDEIDRASSTFEVRGARCPDEILRLSGR